MSLTLSSRIQNGCPNRQIRIVRSSDLSNSGAFVVDAPRRRRVRRRDRQAAKRPEPLDLEKEMEEALLKEEARWRGPSEAELREETSHPVLGGLLECVLRRMIQMSLVCGSIMETIFEENFPNTKVAVDYIEFRLLEVDGKGVKQILQFFLDFGYEEVKTIVMTRLQKPIHCQILKPPPKQNLPKIVLSHLDVDKDLSDNCKKIIKKRMDDWLKITDTYCTTALGVVGAPWSFPTKSEFNTISDESTFAAWCMIHGLTPASMAVSVNAMRKSAYKFGANPEYLQLEHVYSALGESFPMNPYSQDPLWAHSRGFIRVVAPVAEVVTVSLTDGNEIGIAGSNIAFVERNVLPEFAKLEEDEDFMGYEEQHLDHEIDEELLMYMHGCIDTAVLVSEHAESVHRQVIQKAESEGKVLTLDGSNEEDEALYKKYYKEIVNETMLFEEPKNTIENENEG